MNSARLITLLLGLASISRSATVFNGDFSAYTTSTDFDKWSFSNKVGQYQTYIYPDTSSTYKFSTFYNLDASFKNPNDASVTLGARAMINDSSVWHNNNQLRRIELIPNMDNSAYQTGTIYYQWSMMQGSNYQMDSAEHQLVFMEAHFSDLKFGGDGGAGNLWLTISSNKVWSTAFTPGVWHNFAQMVDYSGKQVAFWYSTGANQLAQIVAPTACSAVGTSDWHVGILRVTPNNGAATPQAYVYYSSIKVTNAIVNAVPGTNPTSVQTSAQTSQNQQTSQQTTQQQQTSQQTSQKTSQQTSAQTSGTLSNSCNTLMYCVQQCGQGNVKSCNCVSGALVPECIDAVSSSVVVAVSAMTLAIATLLL